ncbi:MAG: diacylglycerol kinase [Sulfurospirillum sp.]|nr:diacylglycerol kinase [Sulfurospirillum sp.]
MRNQPKYNFFKNTSYALKGLVDIISNEKSFKIELIFALVLVPALFFIDLSIIEKLLLFITLMQVLVAESINSAIERVVDLVTKEYHPMAGRAKDVGSSVVFLSIAIACSTWFFVIYSNFF